MTGRWRIAIGAGLVGLSALLYALHYLIFKDAHHIFIYMVGDIAFVPIEVLLVTLILHQLLERREKAVLLSKLNMVIGAFFSEVGTEALVLISGFDPSADELSAVLRPSAEWTDADFARASSRVEGLVADVDAAEGDLEALATFLAERREFLLRLLENPNLLEHESFTDLLWATLHLTEELESREDLSDLPASDLAHLSGDIRRAYALILEHWLGYMRHLRDAYPYLYSLALRKNPFDPEASVEVV
ncbi:MAG: hypothetical protein Kow0056_05990 [Coriobacteriia bacterium]